MWSRSLFDVCRCAAPPTMEMLFYSLGSQRLHLSWTQCTHTNEHSEEKHKPRPRASDGLLKGQHSTRKNIIYLKQMKDRAHDRIWEQKLHVRTHAHTLSGLSASRRWSSHFSLTHQHPWASRGTNSRSSNGRTQTRERERGWALVHATKLLFLIFFLSLPLSPSSQSKKENKTETLPIYIIYHLSQWLFIRNIYKIWIYCRRP